MKLLKDLNRKFFPLVGTIPYFVLTPILYVLVSLYAMVFPPLDVAVYKRAADFVFSGLSPYSPEFITGDVYLPWVYTPFGTLFLLPLHFVPQSGLLIFWTIFGILIPLAVLILLGYQAQIFRNDFLKKEKIALFVLVFLLSLSTGPIIDAWAIGQIGVLLTALTLFDLAAPKNWFQFKNVKLPRGVLAGIAGAIKLVPLIAIPYWMITKQWKCARTALVTLISTWTLAFVVLPQDSIKYFSEKRFLGTSELSNAVSSDNQSLIGTFMRLLDQNPLAFPIFVSLFLFIIGVGLFAARATYLNGDTLAAGLIVGLTGVLASPVTWIHHIAWLAVVPGAVLSDNKLRTKKGTVTRSGWLWFATLFLMAVPPVRYGWSPVRWIGLEEHYSLLSIFIIWLLWWRSNQSKPQAKN